MMNKQRDIAIEAEKTKKKVEGHLASGENEPW